MLWQRSHFSLEQNKEDTGNERYGLGGNDVGERETIKSREMKKEGNKIER
jgi:hypothetical protein